MMNRLQNFSPENYKTRLLKLQQQLATWNVQACVIENPVDILYLLGLQLSLGMLIVARQGMRLFVDGRYFHAASTSSPIPVSALETQEIIRFLQEEKIEKLGFDSAFTTVDRSVQLESFSVLQPLSMPLKQLRAIKDPQEIRLLEESAALMQEGFYHMQSVLKTGMTEKELAFEFETFCRRKGAEKLSFDPIVAFGENSAMPHYHPSDRALQPGDIVLIDIGVVLDHYHSDMTRVLFWKQPDPELTHLLDVVKRAQNAAFEKCIPQTPMKELDLAARAVMREADLEQYFVHNLGHGIGLQTHEFPRVGSKSGDKEVLLEESMVITIEPGLYIPGKGGVRYEDMVLITKDGGKRLTRC